LNNTISGAIAIFRRHDEAPLGPGPACVANAYIGQFSVQAIDFNILIISLTVLLTVRQPRFMMEPPWWQIVLVCALPWIPPLITGEFPRDMPLHDSTNVTLPANVGLAFNVYGPVSGNWCWVTAEHFAMRYLLTHAWRIAIFVATIGIYTYIYIYLMRAYGKLDVGNTVATGTNGTVLSDLGSNAGRQIRVRSSVTTSYETDKQPLTAQNTFSKSDTIHETDEESGPGADDSPTDPDNHTKVSAPYNPQQRARKQAIRKMLLLNGYPILYVILWIPGIANRITEAFGHSPVWLRALQASTQLVGLANALTYAYNEQLLLRIRMPLQH
jgi:hypothetical protein